MIKDDLVGPNHEIHFLTFAAGKTKLRMAGKRLTREAIESCFFETVKLETEDSLKSDYVFWRQHSAFITNKMNANGWGKWLWKPHIIRKHLNRIPKNSLLLYLDAGCHLNLEDKFPRERLNQYASIAASGGSLAMQLVNGQFDQKEINDLSEETWCPQDILKYLKVPEYLQKTPQIQAGILLFRNDSDSKNFLNDWFDSMVHDNYAFLRDYPRVQTDDLDFRGHRYDQSVFSPLYKLSNLPTIDDETWFAPNWSLNGADFPIWAKRNKSGMDFRKSYFWNLRKRVTHIILMIATQNH